MHSSDLSVEPSVIESLSAQQQQTLAGILDRYLCALEDGVPVDPESLVAQHPDLREPLRAYLRSLDNLHNLAAGFAAPSDDASGGQGAATRSALTSPTRCNWVTMYWDASWGVGGWGLSTKRGRYHWIAVWPSRYSPLPPCSMRSRLPASERGAGGRSVAPSEHCAGVCRGGAARRALLRHAVN